MYSTLAERMETVIKECNARQTTFAKSVGVTPNYISMIIHGKKELISPTLALLIEHLYGYSHEWLLSGEGPKLRKEYMLKNITKRLESLDADALSEVDNYIKSL